MIKLYGKKAPAERLLSLSENDRMPHALLITGEKGAGKLTFAKWCAMLMLCESENKPCGECNSCKKILLAEHPDVIYAKDETGYKVKDVRSLLSGSVYLPNDSDKRVYIFADCDEMRAESQNALLKAIEEPSHFNRYIFTCTNPDDVLVTIRSRLTAIPLPEMNTEELGCCLAENGVEKSSATEYAKNYGGTPGYILSVIADEKKQKMITDADVLSDALARENEYDFLKTLSSYSDREEIFKILEQLYKAVSKSALPISCDGVCDTLQKKLTTKKLCAVSEYLGGILSLEEMNLNARIFTASVTAEIFGILQ